MANAPDSATLTEFARFYKEAGDVSLSHNEFLALVFMAAVDLYRIMPSPTQ